MIICLIKYPLIIFLNTCYSTWTFIHLILPQRLKNELQPNQQTHSYVRSGVWVEGGCPAQPTGIPSRRPKQPWKCSGNQTSERTGLRATFHEKVIYLGGSAFFNFIHLKVLQLIGLCESLWWRDNMVSAKVVVSSFLCNCQSVTFFWIC